MRFVFDSDGVTALAGRMDLAADDADANAQASRRAIQAAELPSAVPDALFELADDHRFVASVLRAAVETVAGNELTLEQLAFLTGTDQVTTAGRIELLAQQGITEPLDVLGALLILGPPQTEPSTLRQITIGAPPPGENPEFDEAVERLDADALPAILRGGSITITSEQQRRDLETVAPFLFLGNNVPIVNSNGSSSTSEGSSGDLSSVSDSDLSDLVGAGVVVNMLGRQAETDMFFIEATFIDPNTQPPDLSGEKPGDLNDGQLAIEFNGLKDETDADRESIRSDEQLAQNLQTTTSLVSALVGGARGSLIEFAGFAIAEGYNSRAAATREAIAEKEERLLDLGVEIASRKGVNIFDGEANRVDGEGNVIIGDENLVDGNNNGIIGDNNRIFDDGSNNRIRGDDNRIFGGDDNRVRGNGNQVGGDNNTIDGDSNRSFGSGNGIDGDGNEIEGDGNSVLGNENEINGNRNTVGDDDREGGENNQINGNDNTVIGDNSGADGSGSTVIGDNSFALGGGRQIEADNVISTPFGDVNKETGEITLNNAAAEEERQRSAEEREQEREREEREREEQQQEERRRREENRTDNDSGGDDDGDNASGATSEGASGQGRGPSGQI